MHKKLPIKGSQLRNLPSFSQNAMKRFLKLPDKQERKTYSKTFNSGRGYFVIGCSVGFFSVKFNFISKLTDSNKEWNL